MTSLRKSMLPQTGPFGAQPNLEAGASETNSAPPTPSQDAADGVMGVSSPDLSIVPTEAQIRAKTRFWNAWTPTGELPTIAEIKKLTNSSSIERWVQKPGFLAWFMNSSDFEEKAAYLSDLALRALEDVLLQTDPKSQGARVSAVKQVIELRRLLASAKPKGDTPEGKVDGMNTEELLKLLAAAGYQVVQQINIPAKDSEK